jgi:hypothetical protein
MSGVAARTRYMGSEGGPIAIEDVNGDGMLDVIGTDLGSDEIVVYRNVCLP